MGQPGLFDLDERYRRPSEAGDPLVKLASLVDFESFRPRLAAALKRPRLERRASAYGRLGSMDKAAYLDFVPEIIRRQNSTKGFEVIPRRWVVERTFGWMIRWRRPVRDYERPIDVSTAMIHVAMGGILVHRNPHP